jgi:hypothetical protein
VAEWRYRFDLISLPATEEPASRALRESIWGESHPAHAGGTRIGAGQPVRVAKVFRQIGVNDIGVAPTNQPVHFPDCVGRTAAGRVAIGTILEIRLEDLRPRRRMSACPRWRS